MVVALTSIWSIDILPDRDLKISDLGELTHALEQLYGDQVRHSESVILKRINVDVTKVVMRYVQGVIPGGYGLEANLRHVGSKEGLRESKMRFMRVIRVVEVVVKDEDEDDLRKDKDEEAADVILNVELEEVGEEDLVDAEF